MLPTVDIVIVNWNAGELLYECVSSIKNALNNNYELKSVVVVDNYSADSSLDKLNEIDLPIKIIRNDKNLGFAKACNIGVFSCDSDYVLILNPDTKLYEDSIYKPLKFLIDNFENKIGMLGVKIVDAKNEISKNCARFPSPIKIIYQSIGLDKVCPRIFKPHFMIEWNHDENRVVDQIMGSYILMPRFLFKTLNGYDEQFFVYYEDLDLSLRAKQLGWKNYYFSESKIFHKGGGTSDKVKASRLFYSLDSKLKYSKKHFSKNSYLLILFFVFLFEPISRILFALFKFQIINAKETLIAYKKLYRKYLFNT